MVEITKTVNNEAINEARILLSNFWYMQENILVGKNEITITSKTKIKLYQILERIEECENLYKYFGKELQDIVYGGDK